MLDRIERYAIDAAPLCHDMRAFVCLMPPLRLMMAEEMNRQRERIRGFTD